MKTIKRKVIKKIQLGRGCKYLLRCNCCEKEFWLMGGHYNLGEGKFCSYKCYYISRIGRFTGKNSSRWNGGETISSQGYIMVCKPEHCHSNKQGYIGKHRLVAEKALGRLLTKTEIIHHINCIRSDNKSKNLYLFSTDKEHKRYHMNLRHNKIKPITKSNLLECLV